MGPGRTVESLDNTSGRQIRPIVDSHARQQPALSLSHYLTQGLQTVESTPLVIAQYRNALSVYRKPVSTGDLPDSGLGRFFLSEFHSQPDRLLIPGRQKIHVILKLTASVYQTHTCSHIQSRLFRRHFHFMRHRIDYRNFSFCILPPYRKRENNIGTNNQDFLQVIHIGFQIKLLQR